MYIFDVNNREDIKEIVVQNLRNCGIKHRIKKYNSVRNLQHAKRGCQTPRFFKVPLVNLNTDAVFLSCGAIIEVPSLVLDACCRIRENVEIEGIFRKAGSSVRQKEIKAHLEEGGHLQPQHNVIDIANILKMFFRDLPEPLIPYTFHDIFLRCLLLEDKMVDTLLQMCLLLPTPHLNVLAYFMDVLKEVSNHYAINKMDARNIALIITPSIMPVDQKLARHCATRLECHVKVIELLIQHAEIIGMIPACARNCAVVLRHSCPSLSHGEYKGEENSSRHVKKKKRSGSLTRVLNGIKKMVGKGSPELEENMVLVNASVSSTPCVKSGKKRRAADLGGAFSSKKRREVLKSLPQNVALASFPYFPSPSVVRVLRFSPPGSTYSQASCSRFTEEVGSSSSIPVKKEESRCEPESERRKRNSLERLWDKVKRRSTSDVPVSTHMSKHKEPHSSSTSFESTNEVSCNLSAEECDLNKKQSPNNVEESEIVKIFKSEYEDIKNRVTAIESHIFQEFGHVSTASRHSSCEISVAHTQSPAVNEGDNAESVQCKYEKTLEQSIKLENTSADQLARILGRELKIRRSSENKVIRSPSARKIGTIRRRSKENHSEQTNDVGTKLSLHLPLRQEASCSKPDAVGLFYERSSLRRGRPNTVRAGLPQCTALREANAMNLENNSGADVFLGYEQSDPNVFQSPFQADNNSKQLQQSLCKENRKLSNVGIREDGSNSENWNEACRYFVERNNETETCHTTGRPSVAWLRNANVGMVMARTKLFDGSSLSPRYSSGKNSAQAVSKVHTPHISKHRTKSKSPTCSSGKEMRFHSSSSTKSSPRKIGTPRRKTLRSLSSGRKDHVKSKKSPAKGSQAFTASWAGQAKENIDIPHLYSMSPNHQNIKSILCDGRRVLKEKSPLKDCNVIKFEHKDVVTREMPYIKKPLLVKSPSCYNRTPQHNARSVRNHTPLKALTPLPCSPRCFSNSQ